ncbi:hypothetical protein NHX12_017507 [Muraenolepis orangiensis]|uniref:Raptor N-terminal CASPase-like domain-containing protein n=1 Tax=Muraenolepis orangiensis TaxID=630683 RepID=A0A9Q0EWR6_9TELE|nr:hypothetical protein NHX12_017507 [Muraenolepis orangiensis]
MKMDVDLLQSPAAGLAEVEEPDLSDWKLPLAFMKKRHSEKIEGSKALAQSWRMKDRGSQGGWGKQGSGLTITLEDHVPFITEWRMATNYNTCDLNRSDKLVKEAGGVQDMKTVSVALVLCLNVGVDPPDVVKTSPCARLECWIDPLSMSPQKALETIGANLQKQYENWQPRKSTLVGTLNVRTMFQTGKAETIAKEMVRYNLSVLGLVETRWTQSGEVKLPSGQSVIYSGHEEDGANHTEGIAVMMSKETRKALIAWKPISSRLITASFRTNNRRVKAHIIQCYAPTNDAVDDVKARFYEPPTW